MVGAALTVILPTFNRSHLLGTAIRSVLEQEFRDLHLLVLDNCSTDDTATTVETFAKSDPRVEYVRHASNIGAFANFQHGLGCVETEFFAFLSDDDRVLPACYAAAISAAANDPGAAMISMRTLIATWDGRVRPEKAPVGTFEPPIGLLQLIRRGHITWTGTIFRTKVLEETGALREESDPIFDLDFQYRVAATRRIVLLAQPGALFAARPGVPCSAIGWLPIELETTRRIIDDLVNGDQQDELRLALSERMIARTFAFGVAAALEGDRATARLARAGLRESPVRCAVLELTEFACRVGSVRRRLERLRVKLRPSTAPSEVIKV